MNRNDFRFSNYEPTGNTAIDHCANLIACARVNEQALEALELSPIYYEWFKSGVKTMIESKIKDKQEREDRIMDVENGLMEFDTVKILKGSKFQTKPVIIKYWTVNE